MRIQVDCRKHKGAIEPRSFVLGNHRIWILHVLERHRNDVSERFKVASADGREFALRQDLGTGEWELGAVRAGK